MCDREQRSCFCDNGYYMCWLCSARMWKYVTSTLKQCFLAQWQYVNQFNTCLFLLMCCQWSAYYSPASTSSSEHSTGVWQMAQWNLHGHIKCTVKSTFPLHVLLLNDNVPFTFFTFWLSSSEGELSYLLYVSEHGSAAETRLPVCKLQKWKQGGRIIYSLGSCSFVNLT